MPLTIAHYRLDVLPRWEQHRGKAGNATFTLYVPLRITPDLGANVYPRTPLGIDPATGAAYNVVIEYQINDQPSQRISLRDNRGHGRIDAITLELVAELRRKDLRRARPYANISEELQEGTRSCAEGVIPDIAPGSLVCYRAHIDVDGNELASTPRYRLSATAPQFTSDDLRLMNPTADLKTNGWIVYYKNDGQFHHFRFDYLDISYHRDQPDALPDFDLALDTSAVPLRFSLADPSNLRWLPIINADHDYVVLSIPIAQVAVIHACSWRGVAFDHTQVRDCGTTRVMFIHFCTQGLNDLFAKPLNRYTPPRTFIQVAMRDERGAYSGRPDTLDDGKPDGYIYALQNHERYGLKYLWTFNAGVLSLLAHDCPDDLATMRGYIDRGLMEPTLAGYGGHALPYYQEQTNRDAITYNAEVIERTLGRPPNKVYYLDQRLYKQIDVVKDALKSSGAVCYIVAEGTTGFNPFLPSVDGSLPDSKRLWHYLWRDRWSGLYILYIDSWMRDNMAAGDYYRGKLHCALRTRMMLLASNPSQFAKNLLIYGDDADHASGNGWFDGSYNGPEQDYCDEYAASLEWIADHPWIQVVGSRDLQPESDCIGTIDMQSSITEAIDPDGQTKPDCYGKYLHFDAWYDNWKLFRSPWLDQSLEQISQSVEYALIDLPDDYHNELYTLAKLGFLVALQESQWNKQQVGDDVNCRHDVVEPEDFVIAASLQLRNAMVYACAAVWSTLAGAGVFRAGSYCNGGPLIEALQGLTYRAGRTGFTGPIDATGLHWDRDLLPNTILYNADVLVVMDENGGRITHLFARKDGTPYCLSGTMKAYQFLTDREYHGTEVFCDGEVLQNTVYTPNHAYIACDVREALGAQGWKFDPRTSVNIDTRTYYPDNFNSYLGQRLDSQTVEWAYERTQAEPTEGMTIARFRALLAADREGRRSGTGPVVQHARPPFKKRIRLVGRKLLIDYFETRRGHIVANEFSLDLLEQLLSGRSQTRSDVGASLPVPNEITISGPAAAVQVTITTKDRCQFSADTLKQAQGVPDRRLHRVLTDCLEIEATADGGFSYEIVIW